MSVTEVAGRPTFSKSVESVSPLATVTSLWLSGFFSSATTATAGAGAGAASAVSCGSSAVFSICAKGEGAASFVASTASAAS
ncbi:hypothetical protein D3C81_1494900 [compost metagenome]